MSDDRSLTLRLPVELHTQIKAAAEAEDRSVSQMIRRMCRVYLEEQRHPLRVIEVQPGQWAQGPLRNVTRDGAS